MSYRKEKQPRRLTVSIVYVNHFPISLWASCELLRKWPACLSPVLMCVVEVQD